MPDAPWPPENAPSIWFMDEMENFVRELMTHRATISREGGDSFMSRVTIEPHAPGAAPMRVAAGGTSRGMLSIGHADWSFTITEETAREAQRLMRSAFLRGAVGRDVMGRSQTTVILDDGSPASWDSRDGCGTALIPLPGWQHWAMKTVYAPYHG